MTGTAEPGRVSLCSHGPCPVAGWNPTDRGRDGGSGITRGDRRWGPTTLSARRGGVLGLGERGRNPVAPAGPTAGDETRPRRDVVAVTSRHTAGRLPPTGQWAGQAS